MTTLPRFFCRFLPAILALLVALPTYAAFTDNGDGTVTDTVTGLMWDKCSWGQGDNTTCATWTQALGVAVTANGASYKNHNDWRLPNKNELESLVDLTRFSPSIDTAAFPNTPSWKYWSSTSYAPVPIVAWAVGFDFGQVTVIGEGHKELNQYCVRLVRSGQLFGSFDAQDTIPDAFSFTAQTNASLSSLATSNTLTVAGINSAAAISITGGTYSINGGSYTAAAGTVNNGDTVTVRQTSSGSYSTLTTATLTIGSVSGAFDVTTQAAPVDTVPDAFSFTAQTGAALNTVATSNTITVAGINSASAIGISGGTYSINGGGYVSTAGTVNNGDTVTVHQTSSASYSTLTTATLTIGGVSGAFDVTTAAAPASPPPPAPTPTGPVVSCLGLTGIPSGFSVSPCILDLGSGDGTGIISGLTTTLANALGLPNFSHQNQSGSGTVVMQYDGGKLVFLPLSVQTGDPRPNGIYPAGNGKYVVVTNGTAVTVAPGIINLAELGALIPGWTLQVDEQGIISATHNGTTYVVQPGYLVQLSSGGPSLWMGSDGYPHFTDSAGNSQTLYPAFLEPSWLLNYLLALDGNASLSIQLDGTGLIRLFGQNYVLSPDLILGGETAEHSAEYWWQEGERRYRMRNRIHFGTTQGFTVR